MKSYHLLSLALFLSFLNLSLILGQISLGVNYGNFTLYKGENYTINIPFNSYFSFVCGKAYYTDNTPAEGINIIIVKKSDNNKIGESVTDKNGNYCIKILQNNEKEDYSIYVVTGENLTLGSNDYDSYFTTNKKVYNKSEDKYVVLIGNISNKDAEINNGRMIVEVKIKNSQWELINSTKYYVNIKPNELYNIPNNNLNITWQIQQNIKTGEYKFRIDMSFNGKYHYKEVYFNITE